MNTQASPDARLCRVVAGAAALAAVVLYLASTFWGAAVVPVVAVLRLRLR